MVEPILEQAIDSIADAEGVEPRNLDISLEDYVSTDAVRSLVLHESDSWRIQFETPNHVVEISGNNTILVDGERARKFR